jgi:hypothetical protein
MNISDARIVHGTHPFPGPAFGTVVHDDDLHFDAPLRARARNGFEDQLLSAKRRDHNADVDVGHVSWVPYRSKDGQKR